MKFNESTLKAYAAPLSDTEDLKCRRAIEAIRDALKDLGYTDDQKPVAPIEADTLAYSVAMRNRAGSEKVTIFIQGSYANNTCVRGESDVDIAVVHENNFEYAFGERFSDSTTNRQAEAMVFKNTVEHTLRNRFPGYVHRKNKSIKVDGNTYRKQADTVPCLSMHYYYRSHLNDYSSFKDGIVIYADDGTIIRNFPKQHIANGKAKNVSTNHYYKKMVRIIKKMRYLMSECGYSSANNVSSFGLESLLWNIPDSEFTKYSYHIFGFKEIVDYLYYHKYMLSTYKEANGIKPLCPNQQDVENYSRFIDALYGFYQYEL